MERFRAKKDVAYDRYKVGAEKEIQDMKQEISESSIKTGELNNSLLEAQETIKNLKNDLKMANDTLEASPSSEVKLKELQDAISELKYDNYMKDKKLTANGALMASWRAQVLNLGGNPDEETPNSKN